MAKAPFKETSLTLRLSTNPARRQRGRHSLQRQGLLKIRSPQAICSCHSSCPRCPRAAAQVLSVLGSSQAALAGHGHTTQALGSFLGPQSSAGVSSQALEPLSSGSCSKGRMEDDAPGRKLCPYSAGRSLLSRTWCPALEKPVSLSASDSWGFVFASLKTSRRVTKASGMQALDCFDPGAITAVSRAFLAHV